MTAGAGADLTPEEYELAVSALLGAADRARVDRAAFFDLVMRHETTGQPLTALPHQRLQFDFIAAHPMCVIRQPVGTSKTFTMAAMAMALLGADPTSRGAIVSATQGQAMKPLGMVRDYIESSAALKMVYPKLRKSPRKGDSWANSEITVDRPPGIRDPSVVAAGIDGAITGARLSWVVVDDILDRENTSTPHGLKKVHDWFDSSVLSRLDPAGAHLIVTNTPWHPEDLTYRLEGIGWPTMTMDVEGTIRFSNVLPDWDSREIVPSSRPGEVYRLAAHAEPTNDAGEAIEESVPLWPGRYDWATIDKLRETHLPHRFNQLYMCVCRDDEQARCKVEWVDRCKEAGRGVGLTSQYSGTNYVMTGVDLAIGKGAQYDSTAFFTFEQLADGKRKILDVEAGQWDAPTIVDKLLDKLQRYRSIARVESNAAQEYLLQFARARNASAPIKAHVTGRGKAHPEFGVEALFIELQNGAWIIPCDTRGRCAVAVQRFLDECLYYQPGAHTGDLLMAAYLAREQARDLGLMAGRAYTRADHGKLDGLAARLLRR